MRFLKLKWTCIFRGYVNNLIILFGIVLCAPTNTYSQNTWYGENAGLWLLRFGRYSTDNSFFGFASGQTISRTHYNSFFGFYTGHVSRGIFDEDPNGTNNGFFGANSGNSNLTGHDNGFFGYKAGYSNSTEKGNSFFGAWAGLFNIVDANSFFGAWAGGRNSTGLYNSFLGFRSGEFNITSSGNTFMGYLTGTNSTGGNNTLIGSNSAPSLESGENNTFIGYKTGYLMGNGEDNVFIGSGAGLSANGSNRNVFIGSNSGFHVIGNNNIIIGNHSDPPTPCSFCSLKVYRSSRLYIDVEFSDTPLIYGEFDNNLIRINGGLEILGSVDPSSDFNMKTAISELDDSSILDKVQQMDISEWEYKDQQGIRHIGVMAQDFRVTFDIGKRETTIATLDADGVVLCAIKALKKNNNRLKKDLIDLRTYVLGLIQSQFIPKHNKSIK